MKFTKMHGCGNDYIYVDCTRHELKDPEKTAVFVSDRHFGIGSDGLILIKSSRSADFEMDMYNLDGSRGKMCGNGIRCVAKYVYDHGMTDKTHITVDTGSGVKELELFVEDGKVARVWVDMGEPVLIPEQIPLLRSTLGLAEDKKQVVKEALTVQDDTYEITCVSMGNPHCVVLLSRDVREFPLDKVGPAFEHHPLFPEGVNTEFFNVIDRTHLRMRVWERGSGETLACGTGTCATLVAAVLCGVAERQAEVELTGGNLSICWDEATGHVFMTGPAEEVFSGEINLPWETV